MLNSFKSLFSREGLLYICKGISKWFIELFTFKKLNSFMTSIGNLIKYLWKITVNLFLLAVALVILCAIIVTLLCYIVISCIAKSFKIVGSIMIWIGNIIQTVLDKFIYAINNMTDKIKKLSERKENEDE